MKRPRWFPALILSLGFIAASLWFVNGDTLSTQADSPHHVALDCTSVPAPCHTSLQAAVDAAITGDVILVASGVYADVHARSAPIGYPDPPAGNVITQVVYISKTITIRGGYTVTNWTAPSPLTQLTTLNAQGQGRAIVIAGTINPTIEGVRLTGGNADGLGGSSQESSSRGGGGAVYIISATGTLSNNLIFGNTASEGGGLFLRGSAATLNGNTIISNAGGYSGGGVMLYQSTATLKGNIINANTALAYGLGSGGGICTYKGTATLIDNTIAANVVESNGGGIFLNNSLNSTLIGNTILTNTAGSTGRGGGLWMRYDDGTVLEGNTFIANNGSSRGGAIYGDQGNVTLLGNRMMSNTAESGGGLYLSGRAVTLTGNSVLSNTALMGGGLYLEYNDSTLNGNTLSFNAATLENGEGGGVFLDFSDALLNGDIITFNRADRGGGLSTYHSSPVITNTVFADNIAGKNGSGLHIRLSSMARLWHTTIARNWGGDGSGVYIDFMGDTCAVGIACTVAMTNTILVSHTVGITVSTDSTVTLASTLWYGNVHDWDGTGAILTGSLNYRGDPHFALDGYHLLSDSLAMDKGINAGVTIDIDGDARPQGGGYDLGADERVGPAEWRYLYLPLILRN